MEEEKKIMCGCGVCDGLVTEQRRHGDVTFRRRVNVKKSSGLRAGD